MPEAVRVNVGNRGSEGARIRSEVRSNTEAQAVNGPPRAFAARMHVPPSGANRRRSPGVSVSTGGGRR